MVEQHGDLWQLAKGHTLCITTNGFIKKSGGCVMGRGIALQAANRFPALPQLLGDMIRMGGNHVHSLGWFHEYKLLSFPTKHNWYEKADLKLIKRSAEELVAIHSERSNLHQIFVPRPGCSNGGLEWEDVKSVIEPILLGDWFIVVTNE